MGFGTSATEIIIFIGSVLVAVSVAGALGIASINMAAGFKDKADLVKDELETEFEIINDPDNIPLSGTDYIFYLKNTGKNNFYFNSDTVSVFIDGQLVSPSQLSFSSQDGISLKRSEVGQILVGSSISSGYHRIKVVLHNGIDREMVFRV